MHALTATARTSGIRYRSRRLAGKARTTRIRIITQVEINQAKTADATTLVSGLEKLDTVDLKPVILLTDNGYASDENAQAAAKMGVTHMAPPGGEARRGARRLRGC